MKVMKVMFVALSVLVVTGLAQATTFSTGTAGTCDPTGSSTATVSGNSGNPVNASATVTTSGSTITIVLKNCFASPTTVAQNISDVFFTVAGASGGSLGTQTASYINIDGSGNATSTTDSDTWGLDTAFTGSSYHLTDLGFGTATPAETIIGPGPYCASNDGSICGNKPHNPFINQTATFTITGVSGTLGAISGVDISFGTTPSSAPTTVPEPSSLLMFGSGLFGVAGILRRRFLRA